eukprot:TRINITY_DN3161_c0_g1_i1.p1 TRINITY_DN3161_c0_g1~~TRINITY_DN3161_c0_g1_i1.p1  ORF type:complete len:240 (+),score=46.99 TRINITY_DN3161_c0_g1_i1:18-737(+)
MNPLEQNEQQFVQTQFRSSRSLKETEMSITIPLLPHHIGDLTQGIYSFLDNFIMKFMNGLDGILLAYRDVVPMEPNGRIYDDAPHIHIRVQFKALSFSPVIGSNLVGRVTQMGMDHLGLLVLGVFNASIAKEDLPSQFSFDDTDPDNNNIKVGTTLVFQVLGVNQSEEIISIKGSLKEEGTGLLEEVAKKKIPELKKTTLATVTPITVTHDSSKAKRKATTLIKESKKTTEVAKKKRKN